MIRFISYISFALVLSIAVVWCSSAQAVTWATSLSGLGTSSPAFPTDPGLGYGNWNAIYAQGFSAGTNTSIGGVSADPGITTGATVYLQQFDFWRSGRTSVNDDGSGGTLPALNNVRLAIVNNFFLNLSTFTTSSPELVALSTNTITSIPISAANSGSPLVFSFNNTPLTYGPASDQNLSGEDYAAIFVNVNGTTITPVRVPAIIVNYALGADPNNPSNYAPQHNYGDPAQDYLNAVSNYINGNYFATFNTYYADADFSATFSSTPLSSLIHGDVNGDGHVNAADIVALQQALMNRFLLANVSPTVGDFNGNGQVDNGDLQGLLTALKNGQGSTSGVPEPSAFVLSALGCVALLLYGRRLGSRTSRANAGL
jgi:hypothetical protein